MDERITDRIFARVLERYRDGPFHYLLLEYAGRSIRLCRDDTPTEMTAVAGRPVQVLAPSVGLVDSRPGQRALPAFGNHVSRGEPLLVVRRFRDSIEVRAAASGTARLSVRIGDFVEFGQTLGAIEPDDG